MRRREESLQELAENLERLARLATSRPRRVKDLPAKEQFIDAILDGDARLRLNESYRLAFRQREFPVRGMYCGAAEGSSTDQPDRGKSLQDDVLAQVKGLLAEVVPF